MLLVHGLGGSWRSWSPILDGLAREREVIAVDLPGHGETPRLAGPTTVPRLVDAVAEFLAAQDLAAVDVVGSSMGAQLVLELARRGHSGRVVSLDPGGFWRGFERHAFYGSIAASIRLVRLLRPVLPALAGSPIGRSLLLAQFSAHPARLSRELVLTELPSYATTAVFDELLRNVAYGPDQEGIAAGHTRAPITIGWGRKDRVCFPGQAARAQALFPDAALHWFADCGHFPHWDQPDETLRLILERTG